MKYLICAGALCLPTLAHAQSDLAQALSETLAPAADIQSLSDTLSCTALFRTLTLVFGPESENFEGFQSREGAMASVSGIIWSESDAGADQSPEEVFGILVPLINTATDQYLAHMDATALTTDAPFDGEILDQLDFCNAIVDALESNGG